MMAIELTQGMKQFNFYLLRIKKLVQLFGHVNCIVDGRKKKSMHKMKCHAYR
jgi:hypothetical protein